MSEAATIRRFRRRPADADLVGAVRFDGSFPLAFLEEDEQVRVDRDAGGILIETRNGTRKATARVGDWILRHHDGGVSACRPDDFDATYEQVRDAGA